MNARASEADRPVTLLNSEANDAGLAHVKNVALAHHALLSAAIIDLLGAPVAG
jgi:hypothetical protein